MLNCGFGLLFLPAGGILLLVMGSSLAETVSEIFETWPGSVPVLFCTAICLLASMNDMAAPSVSLEGDRRKRARAGSEQGDCEICRCDDRQ